jgi:four helix bundle protein
MKGKMAERFEELRVYQQAKKLTNEIYSATKKGPFTKDFGLVDQLRRACVSIMSNIAEGFERGTRPEFARFLYIAKGSCGEARAQLEIAFDQQYLLPAEYERLRKLAQETSGMLSNLISRVKSSTTGVKKRV